MTRLPLINEENKKLFWAFGLVAGSWFICLLVSGVLMLVGQRYDLEKKETVIPPETLRPFISETEFRNYLSTASRESFATDDVMVGRALTKSIAPAELANENLQAIAPERISETNVQVRGIDEPDIVKTDGKQIYIGGEAGYYTTTPMIKRLVPTETTSILPMPPLLELKTQIIQALPPEAIKKVGTLDTRGELLLIDHVLVVINGRNLKAFDISKSDFPELWVYTLADNQSITTSRSIDGKIILVTQSRVYSSIPCPIPLFSDVGKEITIRCTDVLRPATTISADSTFTLLQLDPLKGDVLKQTSFVGSTGQTVVYVSTKAVYVSFTKSANWSTLTADFFLDDNDKLITVEVKDHLRKVMALEISDAAKQVEIDSILATYTANMNDDDRMRWETERNNLMAAYVDMHKRELEQTSIAKLPLSDFKVVAIGSVPGRPLNQFSLDEYQDTFRIATTVGGRNIGGGAKSANDVYVLDTNMKSIGSVLDLGKEERIYAVRFMGNKGYVVTFKETDPLYVLDLADAASPKVAGELKIPGYSSYLHPLTNTLIVGIGKEDQSVKVSLFDVSDSSKPTEVAKYLLTDYWSQVASTHHAFLQDAKHNLFFMPGDKGGYIFSYEHNDLTLLKTIEGYGIQRALYINDNLYLVAENKLTVVSETDWKTIKTLEW